MRSWPSYLPLIHCPGADTVRVGEHDRAGKYVRLLGIVGRKLVAALGETFFQFGQEFRTRAEVSGPAPRPPPRA